LYYFSRKIIQNYEQKFEHDIKYLFRIRKEITGKYEFIKLRNTTEITKSRIIKIVLLN